MASTCDAPACMLRLRARRVNAPSSSARARAQVRDETGWSCRLPRRTYAAAAGTTRSRADAACCAVAAVLRSLHSRHV
eukprot:573336-Pleurochrysis_carterae.AAC.1